MIRAIGSRPEQSSSSKPFLFHLRTCSGIIKTYGKRVEGQSSDLFHRSLKVLKSPEIPTPSAVLHQSHLHHIARHIPEMDPEVEILLLLRRDVLRAHKVRQQVNGRHDAPFAQCLDLGWVMTGEVCLVNVHKLTVNAFETHVLDNGCYSIFQTCPSFVHVKETSGTSPERLLGQTAFNQTQHDNNPAPSMEDILFLTIMDSNVYGDNTNNWVAPLSFEEPCQH